MFRSAMRAFLSPVAGPVGFALALAMCGLLVVTVLAAQRNERALQARITTLMAENLRNGIVLHARLAACEGGPADEATARSTSANATPEERAQRLTGKEPVGFDVCARMESADRAVLESLK
jgi:Tfp pilus assembly protein PilX